MRQGEGGGGGLLEEGGSCVLHVNDINQSFSILGRGGGGVNGRYTLIALDDTESAI